MIKKVKYSTITLPLSLKSILLRLHLKAKQSKGFPKKKKKPLKPNDGSSAKDF